MADNNPIRDYWKANHRTAYMGRAMSRPVTCADGFRVSVQASEFHYCSPRQYLASGDYSAWEVGFPSEHEPLLDKYMERTDDDPTETVYRFVATDIVNAVIAKHGGLA